MSIINMNYQQLHDYFRINVYEVNPYSGYSKSVMEIIFTRTLNQVILSLWDKGILPFQIDENKWIVGFNMSCSFFYSQFHPVCVGPKKPSKLRKIKKFNVNCY